MVSMNPVLILSSVAILPHAAYERDGWGWTGLDDWGGLTALTTVTTDCAARCEMETATTHEGPFSAFSCLRAW